MHKSYAYALLIAASLGLAACDKPADDKAAQPSETPPAATQPAPGGAPQTPAPAPPPGCAEHRTGSRPAGWPAQRPAVTAAAASPCAMRAGGNPRN